MNISLVQYSPVWENKKSNKDKLLNLVNDSGKTDLLLFPEMTLTGFTMKSDLYFEDLLGESLQFFSSIALSKNSFTAAGIIEKDAGQYFNTLLVIDREGKLISCYRKIHPFSYSSENKHYTGGTAPVIAGMDGWETGLSICYDLRFPELYRSYGKKRVSLIINIANWPDTRIHHWNALLKARAIENQCYIAAVNRVGEAQKLSYPGSSAVYDPMGNEIINCGNKEGVYTTEIFKEQVESTRLKFPFLDDIKLV